MIPLSAPGVIASILPDFNEQPTVHGGQHELSCGVLPERVSEVFKGKPFTETQYFWGKNFIASNNSSNRVLSPAMFVAQRLHSSTLIRMHRTRSLCFDTAPILVLCAKCPACIAKTVFYGWSILWPVKVDMVVIRHGQGKALHILSRDVPNLIMTNSSLLKMAAEIIVNFPIEHCDVPYFYLKNLPEGQWKKCL